MSKDNTKQKNISINFIFSFIKTLMGVIFPLITFPYAMRVLGPEYIGKVDYAQATMTYFTLIAAFGISAYAIREGSRIRNDKKKIEEFASQMFTINLVTMVIGYVLSAVLLIIPMFKEYRWLLVIFSSSMLLTTLGVDWLFNIYEDYVYIAIRTVIFQVISIILLVVFVRDESDYLQYAAIIVFANVGTNIMNFFTSRKYVKLRLTFKKEMWVHMKPMLYIFAMNVASNIYLVMDRSMLGMMTNNNDREVGLYSAAVKIVTVVVTLIGSIRTVMIPRVSYYMENGDEKQVKELNYNTAKGILMLSIPSVVGLFCLSKGAIYLFSGNDFMETNITLRILLIDILFAAMNGFLVNQVFVPYRMDKLAGIATFIGAGTNLVCNAITIPIIGRNGAALSTCVAELAIFIYCVIMTRGKFDIKKLIKPLLQFLIGSALIVAVYFAISEVVSNIYIIMIVTVLVGAMLYFVALLLMKNDMMKLMLDTVMKKRVSK